MSVTSLQKAETQIVKPMLTDIMMVCRALAPVQREQFEVFEGREYEPDELAVELFTSAGPKWALLDARGEPLGVAGFHYLSPGVWQDWLVSTARTWEEFPRATTRACRTMVEAMLEQDARRVQAICLASREDVRKWYRLIGYEYEGTFRSYGVNGEDAVMYARVREDG